MKNYSEQARGRENHEPEEGDKPVPKPVLLLLGLLFAWGLFYIGAQVGAPLAGGDHRTAVMTTAAADGASLYAANCAACHQPAGTGLAGAFPPLANSEWVKADPHIPVAIVTYGLNGPIEVAGGHYQGMMPAFGSQLSKAEVAAVISYIRGSWGNGAGPVETSDVEAVHTRFGADHPAWSGGDQLRAEFGAP